MRSPPLLAVALAALLLTLPADAAAEETTGPAPPVDQACDDARARAVAEVVQGRYDAVQHLEADFEQRTRSVVLGMGALPGEADTAVVSRGRVIFSKPGRMRWAYHEPEQSYVVSNGSVLWIYDVANAQATRLPVGEQVLAGAALQFLLGEGRLAETFRIAAGSCTEAGVELSLVPREAASYERLGLVADPVSGLIRETSIVDLFGNRTRIRFEGLVTNRPPADGTFELELPDGVDIIDMATPR